METVFVKLKQNSHQYKIEIGNGLLASSGVWAKKCLSPETAKIAIVSNAKVFRLYGKIVEESVEKAGFKVEAFLMNDGEKHKNFRVLENVLSFLGEKRLQRTDAVVALGGGVVGDLAGFAAAVYLRGISFLQIPTTFLAMIDSSVGGKTAVNTASGKNLIGAFHQPRGVLIDVETLKTLAKRELTAGFCEAVKQAAISGEKLFNQTARFLQNYSPNHKKQFLTDEKILSELEKLVAAQVSYKAKIVSQDEKENLERTDANSRKILNFGHTFAHALEKITDYKRFKHGEAVGYGILFAAELSKTLAFFDEGELKLLKNVVHSAGILPTMHDIKSEDIFTALTFDKKLIGESLQWILLEKIGKPCIYKDVPQAIIKKMLKEFLEK